MHSHDKKEFLKELKISWQCHGFITCIVSVIYNIVQFYTDDIYGYMDKNHNIMYL